jgi:hypothetical protein
LFFYRIAGLSVASEVALPGAISVTMAAEAPDVRIRAGRVEAELPNAPQTGPVWQFTADRFLMRVPGVARFLLTGGRDIAFETEGDTPIEDMTIFLIGTVFGILLHQRGQIVLHASAVRVGDRAMLFGGPSGAGKSTLAAALSREGHSVLTDDVCAIDIVDGRPMVHADGRQLKLWAQAIARLDFADRQGAAVRGRLQKFYVEPPATQPEPLPLGGVYLLREERPPHAFGIVPLNLADAPLLLRRNAYRPLLVQRMGQQAAYFRAAAAIQAAGGVYWLTRPLAFAEMARAIAALRAHWLRERAPA